MIGGCQAPGSAESSVLLCRMTMPGFTSLSSCRLSLLWCDETRTVTGRLIVPEMLVVVMANRWDGSNCRKAP